MAAGMQVLVGTTAVSVLLVTFAAAQQEGSTETILPLTCWVAAIAPPSAAAGPVDGAEAPVLLQGQVTLPGSKIQLQCPKTTHIFQPPLESKANGNAEKGGQGAQVVNIVYADLHGNNTEQLQAAIPGATGTKGADENIYAVVTLEFQQLPNTAKTTYLFCSAADNNPGQKEAPESGGKKKPVCIFAVTVKSPSPQGPQSCAVPGTTVLLGIPGEGDSTQFSCGSGMKLSPKDEKKAYSDDCATEEDLKNMTLTPPGGSTPGYYTLKATKDPPMKTICYLCESQTAEAGAATTTNCAIKIALRGGSRLTARSVFGVALPWVLALLHFA